MYLCMESEIIFVFLDQTKVPGPLSTDQDQSVDEVVGSGSTADNRNSFGGGQHSAVGGRRVQDFDDQPRFPEIPTNVNRPPALGPVAPPRGSHLPQPEVSTARSPSSERRSAFVTCSTGVSLTPDDIAKAQKYCKYAGSALQFDDLTTAVDLLEKTLRLLKTGSED